MTTRLHGSAELRPAGFVSDLWPALADETLADLLGRLDAAPREVARYLEGGTTLVAVPGIVHDPQDRESIGTGSVLTDGEWMWPDYASALVLKYRIWLPVEFVQHMEALGWVAPSDIDVSAIRPPGFVVAPSQR